METISQHCVTKGVGRDIAWATDRRETRSGAEVNAHYRYEGDAGSYKINATAGLYKLKGNEHPYFSVTGEVLRGRHEEMSGCLHDDIALWFPHFAPVILVHLADQRGVPMHAVENAHHWAGFSMYRAGRDALSVPMSPRSKFDDASLFERDARGVEWSPIRLANYLRVSVERAREIRAYVDNDPGSTREAMRFATRDLEAQWQREADEAFAVIMSGARVDI